MRYIWGEYSQQYHFVSILVVDNQTNMHEGKIEFHLAPSGWFEPLPASDSTVIIQIFGTNVVRTRRLKHTDYIRLHLYPFGHSNMLRRRICIDLLKGQEFLLLFCDDTKEAVGDDRACIYHMVIFRTDEVRTLHTNHRSGWGLNSSSKTSRVHQPAPLSIRPL